MLRGLEIERLNLDIGLLNGRQSLRALATALMT